MSEQIEKSIETALENSPAFIKLRNIIARIEKIERSMQHPTQENNGFHIDTREFRESLRG